MSTAEDYLQFAQMLVNGGALNGRRYLSPKTVELMTSNHTGDMVNGQFGRPAHGHGLRARRAGRGSIRSPPIAACRPARLAGKARTARNQIMDPAEKMVEIIMMQGANGPLQRDFENAVGRPSLSDARSSATKSKEPLMKKTSDAGVVRISVVATHAQKPAAAPKTPWGDPDISGVWTSDAAIGIPLQRPDEFGGRAELTDEEFADKVNARRADAQARARTRSASFRNDNAWLTKSYPPDLADRRPAGRQDARRHAERRERARAARPRHASATVRSTSPKTSRIYDRCITRGIVGSVLPVVYGNGNRIMQAPGQVVISYEMVHDTRVIYTDGRPHVGQKHPPVPRRLARPLGRQHARRRDDELHGPDEHRR